MGCIIGGFDSMNRCPRVLFWNPVQNRMVSTALVMTPEGLTFIGHMPEWAEWDL